MDTNSFTMYLTLIVIVVLIFRNIYQQIALLRAKSKGAIYHKITSEDAKYMIDDDRSLVIIDVRTPNEFKSGHIKKAKNIANINSIVNKYPNKNTKILINCASGSRSIKAAKKLVIKGYKEVYDIGGLSSWKYGTVKN
ncbi:MAG: rhodanese-like domain-containing protein [Pleomorphochaeta sp.]